MKYNYSSNFSMQIYTYEHIFIFFLLHFLLENALWLMNILFANIFLVSLLSSCGAFVVISVYCFLYIFLLERTKSYSNASQPNSRASTCLPPLYPLPSPQFYFSFSTWHLFALCLYFVPCQEEVEWEHVLFSLLSDGCHSTW